MSENQSFEAVVVSVKRENQSLEDVAVRVERRGLRYCRNLLRADGVYKEGFEDGVKRMVKILKKVIQGY